MRTVEKAAPAGTEKFALKQPRENGIPPPPAHAASKAQAAEWMAAVAIHDEDKVAPFLPGAASRGHGGTPRATVAQRRAPGGARRNKKRNKAKKNDHQRRSRQYRQQSEAQWQEDGRSR